MEATLPNIDYDKVVYPAHAYPQTHPRQLSTLAALFGMEPVDIRGARVLELGAANGANLVPMACELPTATFVGIERAATQAAAGQRLIAELGLENIVIQQRDILDLGEELGKFDYIIAHGVYSWVTDDVRTKILSVCREHLNPHGVAYVSYNTNPGWRMRGMLRDMMLFHTEQFSDPKTKARQARSLIQFLSDAVVTEDNPYGMLLTKELASMKEWPDEYFLHDSLAAVNEPVYFFQFMQRAAKHDLQFLGESPFKMMVASNFDVKTRNTLDRVGKSIIATEQYMDFIRNRMFRQTLLCHREIELQRKLRPELMARFHVSSRILPASETFNMKSSTPEEFVAPNGVKFQSSAPIIKTGLSLLGNRYPRWIQFEELFDEAYSLLQPNLSSAAAMANRRQMRETLGEALLKTYATGLLEIAVHPPYYSLTVTDKPRTTPLVRLQSRSSRTVVNLRHEPVRLDELTQLVLALLDGRRTRASLLGAIAEFTNAGQIPPLPDEDAISNESDQFTVLERRLDEVLEKCAIDGLLCP